MKRLERDGEACTGVFPAALFLLLTRLRIKRFVFARPARSLRPLPVLATQALLAAFLTGLAVSLLLFPGTASSASLAYEKTFGPVYIDALRRACPEIKEAQGRPGSLLELFQDRRFDAVEAYGFQAQRFLASDPEEIYWYPHFSAVVVLAVDERCPVPVEGWADLAEGVTIVLPGDAPEREIFSLALARGLSNEPHLEGAFSLLVRLKEERRLKFYPVQRANQYSMAQADGGGDVYVLFAHQAEQLIRRGAPLRICLPQEGTLAFSKGLLSHQPLVFDDSLSAELAAAGCPIKIPAGAVRIADADAFLRDAALANRLYHREILARPVLVPREPHERFTLLVLSLVLTVLWGASLWQRVLHRGTRRAVVLLVIMLLLWEMVRIAKILALTDDIALHHIQWYLFYIFRAALPVSLLWIAWASDEDVLDRKMPRWLKSVFGLNLFLSFLILCNDFHEQFFVFTWDAANLQWQEKLAWGAYAYWTLWFSEILAALLLLLEKAEQQKILRLSMSLPFLLFALFIYYSIAYQYHPWIQLLEITCVTALFFLLLMELCLRTGLIPSNSSHQKFFSHSRLNMQLVDTAGNIIFASAAPGCANENESRISRMAIHGGAIVWHEDMRRLHRRQRQLALLRDALQRFNALLHEKRRIGKKHLALTLKKQLAEELETILESKRPLLRDFRARLMESTDTEDATRLIRQINVLSSYLKKRCVLFLKGQENGSIRPDELSMAVSETCSYLRPLGLHVGVEWRLDHPLCAENALTLFDFFAEFLAEAADRGLPDAFCRFSLEEQPQASFLFEKTVWLIPWLEKNRCHYKAKIVLRDLGHANSLLVRGAAPTGKESAATAEGKTEEEEHNPWKP